MRKKLAAVLWTGLIPAICSPSHSGRAYTELQKAAHRCARNWALLPIGLRQEKLAIDLK